MLYTKKIIDKLHVTRLRLTVSVAAQIRIKRGLMIIIDLHCPFYLFYII